MQARERRTHRLTNYMRGQITCKLTDFERRLVRRLLCKLVRSLLHHQGDFTNPREPAAHDDAGLQGRQRALQLVPAEPLVHGPLPPGSRRFVQHPQAVRTHGPVRHLPQVQRQAPRTPLRSLRVESSNQGNQTQANRAAWA